MGKENMLNEIRDFRARRTPMRLFANGFRVLFKHMQNQYGSVESWIELELMGPR